MLEIAFICVVAAVTVLGIFWGGTAVVTWFDRKSVVRDFDEILQHIHGLVRRRDLKGLERFLHELCEDTPYVDTEQLRSAIDARKNKVN